MMRKLRRQSRTNEVKVPDHLKKQKASEENHDLSEQHQSKNGPSTFTGSISKSLETTEPSKTPSEVTESSNNKSSEATELSQKPSEATELSQKPSEATELSQKPSEATELSQKPSEVTKSTSKSSEATQLLQKPSEVTKSTSKPSETTISSKKPPISTELSQKPLEVTKSTSRPSEITISSKKPSEITEPSKLSEVTEPNKSSEVTKHSGKTETTAKKPLKRTDTPIKVSKKESKENEDKPTLNVNAINAPRPTHPSKTSNDNKERSEKEDPQASLFQHKQEKESQKDKLTPLPSQEQKLKNQKTSIVKLEKKDQEGPDQPSVNRQSTVSQPSVNRQSTVSSEPPLELEKSPTVSQPSVQPSVNRQLTVSSNSLENAKSHPIDALTGKKKDLLFYLFEQCRLTGQLITNPLTNSHLQQVLNSSVGGLRTILWEAKKEGLLSWQSLKKGRIGLRKFVLPPTVFQEILKEANSPQPSVNRQANRQLTVSQPSVLGPSSSTTKDFLFENQRIEKTTTNINEEASRAFGPNSNSSSNFSDGQPHFGMENQIEFSEKAEIEENLSRQRDFLNIMIPEVLAQKFGFGKKLLLQISKMEDVTPEALQRSLEAFAFDLTENNLIKEKRIKNVYSYFYGSLKKLGLYAPPVNFQSDEDKALEEALKRSEEKAMQIKQRQERLKDAEFQIWLSELDETTLRESQSIYGFKDSFHMARLKEIFEKEIWQQKNPF